MLDSGLQVLIGVPVLGGVGMEHIRALERPRMVWGGSKVIYAEGGFLCSNFNWLWCQALNNRMICLKCNWKGSIKASNCPFCGQDSLRWNLTHFIMLHSDVEPLDDYWIDKMIAELERVKSGVLSVILPIKDSAGMSSTAVDLDEIHYKRFTIREFHHRFSQKPAGINYPVLVSPGLWIADLRQNWAHDPEIFFTVQDRIFVNDKGQFDCDHTDDGWGWSHKLHAKGVKVVASQCVRAYHWGKSSYPNFGDWGDVESDKPVEVWKGG